MAAKWERYEDAARQVLRHLREHFRVASVEGRQDLEGKSSTTWEVDALAVCEAGNRILLVEVRRHTKSGIKQAEVAAFAYQIQDVDAAGGIVVSPRPMQSGARTLATHEGIFHLILSADSTPETYLAEYMGRRFIGDTIVERIHATDHCDGEVVRHK